MYQGRHHAYYWYIEKYPPLMYLFYNQPKYKIFLYSIFGFFSLLFSLGFPVDHYIISKIK